MYEGAGVRLLELFNLGLTQVYNTQILLNRLIERQTEDVDKIRRLFNAYRVHNAILQALSQVIMLPLLFAIGGTLVFCLHLLISCRGSLPLSCLVLVAYGFVILSMCHLVGSFGIISLIRGSEQIVNFLQSPHCPLCSNMNRILRKQHLQSARALRPCSIPVGHSKTYSLSTLVIIYDEVISQLMFLRTF